MVHPDGRLEGEELEQFSDPDLMRIFVNEDVPFPYVPERYFRLAVSGELRDLAGQLNDVCENISTTDMNGEAIAEAKNELKSIRREVRIEAAKVLPKDDPALLNLLEVVVSFDPSATIKAYLSWANDLGAVLGGAIHQIHETRQ